VDAGELRQFRAIGLRNVEDVAGFETEDSGLVIFGQFLVIGTSFAADQRGKNRDPFLALANVPA
jgi:hypothetical protein